MAKPTSACPSSLPLRSQKSEHDLDNVTPPRLPQPHVEKVLAEDRRQGVDIGEVEISQTGDGDVELYGIHTVAEHALVHAAPQQCSDHRDKRRMHLPHTCGALQVTGVVQVLAVEQPDEMRVINIIVERELDKPTHACYGIQLLKMQICLLPSDLLVDVLENREEQVTLVAKVMVEHALVRAGALGNRIDPCAPEALG